MCGGYRTATDFDPDNWSDTRLAPYLPGLFARPSEHVRPSEIQPVLLGGDAWSVANLRWGFVPAWGRTDTRPQINARSETAFEKPFWRDAIRTSRCAVATTGYFEWSGEPGRKMRHVFEPVRGGPLILAGLWSRGHADASGTYALMTCEPNAIARAVHDRMPVILPDDDALARWLAPGELRPADAVDLLVPCADELLRATPPRAAIAVQGSLF